MKEVTHTNNVNRKEEKKMFWTLSLPSFYTNDKGRVISRSKRTDDMLNYNCGGYALGTLDWFNHLSRTARHADRTEKGVEKRVQSVINFAKIRYDINIRIIENESECLSNERIVLYREVSNDINDYDFHFIKKGDNNRYYHKRGASPYIDEMKKEEVYSQCWKRYDDKTPYNSKIYILAVERDKGDNNWIYFDMDGTLFDLYGVKGWLDMLSNQDTTPYAIAPDLVDFNRLNYLLKELKNKGYKIGVISWLSKTGTKQYNREVRQVKKTILKKKISLLDKVHIVKYGTNKAYLGRGGILFDDEDKNCQEWEKMSGRKAINCKNNPQIIIETLEKLLNT